MVDTHGSLIERRRYDAYGRPISVSPADVGAQGGVEGTDGLLNNNDAASYNTLYFGGQVKWSTDLADGTTRRPGGTLNSSDYARFNGYFNDGYTGGLGLVSSAEVDLRRGYAGYQYDDVLAGSGIISDKVVSKYHVRHRVLSSDDGKWNRRDPLGFVDGMGLYEYVRSGPITGLDATGLRRTLCSSGSQCASSLAEQSTVASAAVAALTWEDCEAGGGTVTYNPNVSNTCHCRAPDNRGLNGKFVRCPNTQRLCPLPGIVVPAKGLPGQCRCTIGGHLTDCKQKDEDRKPKKPKVKKRPKLPGIDDAIDLAVCGMEYSECLDKAHNDYVTYLGFCTARRSAVEQQECFDQADYLYGLDVADCTARYLVCNIENYVPLSLPWDWFSQER